MGSTKVREKPFNKKKWREQRYSNKAKVQKWDKIKKRQALRALNKELKKSGIQYGSHKGNSEGNNNSAISNFGKAKLEYQKIQEEKEGKRKEIERIKKERSEALKAYKERKAMKFKKLRMKTKKGQPVMKGRIELLLEKIQNDLAKETS